MAVNGFTVADAARMVKSRVRAHAAAVPESHFVQGVDDGHQKLWRLLVMAGKGWFVTTAQITIQDDVYSYNLPADFHSVYFIQGVGGAAALEFFFSPMTEKAFKDARRTTAATDEADEKFPYDIAGSNPARLEMAKLVHANLDEIQIDLHYVRQLDRLVALTDSLDPILWPFLSAVADYAACKIAAGLRDRELAAELRSDWIESRDEILGVADRNGADAMTQTGQKRALDPVRSPAQGRI
jgi:hypothetical protein